MDYPIRAESGKGRSAHIFNLNERAVKIRVGIVQTGINSQYDKRRSVLQAKLTESIKQSV